jgi:hypothetical protein
VIVVIQCAKTKQHNAGYLKTRDGHVVDFVADPAAAPTDLQRIYARPDDVSDDGATWRKRLLDYNNDPQGNPFGLLSAYQLYEDKVYNVYQRMTERYGTTKVFILSAGWGLLRADFLTPRYNITLSTKADTYMRRSKVQQYQDFRMLPAGGTEDVSFFGGKDYLPLFCDLTETYRGRRTLFYNSAHIPRISGCKLRRYETTTRTNWHYECANAFLGGRIDVI